VTLEKASQLAETLLSVQGRWGLSALRPLSTVEQGVDVVSTGFAALDDALGIGGVPRGHMTTLLRHPTSGATTLAYHILASAQGQSGYGVYVDLADTFDPEYAVFAGVDMTRLILVRQPDAEHGLWITRELIQSDGFNAIVFDTGVGKSLTRDCLPMLSSYILSPLRQSSSVFLWLASHDMEQASAVKLEARRTAWLHRRRDIIGCQVEINILKNKFATHGVTTSLDLYFEGGDK
jgi:RecA/RadA recombinase